MSVSCFVIIFSLAYFFFRNFRLFFKNLDANELQAFIFSAVILWFHNVYSGNFSEPYPTWLGLVDPQSPNSNPQKNWSRPIAQYNYSQTVSSELIPFSNVFDRFQYQIPSTTFVGRQFDTKKKGNIRFFGRRPTLNYLNFSQYI